MGDRRFPYEPSKWPGGDLQLAQLWYEALESVGPESVRARLAQNNNGSAGSLRGIADVAVMTKGFGEEWLAWHDKQKTCREARFRKSQIHWTRWAAIAATVAAGAAVARALFDW